MRIKHISKIVMGVALVAFVFALVAVPQVNASVDWGLGYTKNVGLGTQEIRTVAVKVINVLLGILGLVALVIILIGGFRWMTAAGNEENVESAKKTIAAGIIGLVIIFFSYAIVLFVFNVVGNSVSTN